MASQRFLTVDNRQNLNLQTKKGENEEENVDHETEVLRHASNQKDRTK